MIVKNVNFDNPNDIELTPPDGTLVGFYENEILPELTAEMVFTHPAHKFRKDLKKWRGGCPWHKSESGSSFAVDLDSLMWWCAGCSTGGSAIDYVHRRTGNNTKARGVDFVEAIRKLAEMTGRELPKREYSAEQMENFRRLESRRSILQTVINHCQSYIPQPVRDYLYSRGFPDAAINYLGIGYYESTTKVRAVLKDAGHDLSESANAGVLNDALEGYITFPWHDERGRPLTIYGSWQSKIPPEGKPKKLALWNPKDQDRKSVV